MAKKKEKREIVKGKRGGYRPGSGRKPKDMEAGLIRTLDQYIDPEVVANKIADIIENTVSDKTRLEAIKLYYNYRFGRPVEQKNIAIQKEQPIFNIDIEDIEHIDLDD